MPRKRICSLNAERQRAYRPRKSTPVYFRSRADEWETPREPFDELNAEFHFTLDAAAQTHNAKCRYFFSPLDDPLKHRWYLDESG